MFIYHIYLIYRYKLDLTLNNLQWLICHKKIKPNQTKQVTLFFLEEEVSYLNTEDAILCLDNKRLDC